MFCLQKYPRNAFSIKTFEDSFTQMQNKFNRNLKLLVKTTLSLMKFQASLISF